MGRLSLADALAFTVLLGEQDPRRCERAAVRWHGRWELESPADLRLHESELALAALAALTTPARDAGLHALLELGRRMGSRPWTRCSSVVLNAPSPGSGGEPAQLFDYAGAASRCGR